MRRRGERESGREQHDKVSERMRDQGRESQGKRERKKEREHSLNCEWLTTLSEQKVRLHAVSAQLCCKGLCAPLHPTFTAPACLLAPAFSSLFQLAGKTR